MADMHNSMLSRISRRAFSLGAVPFATGLLAARAQPSDFAGPGAVVVTAPPFGAKCDGVTDDSAAIQAAIDRNKGRTIVIPGRALCAGIVLDGALYNGTRIVCQGEFVLKPRPSVSAGNFFGVWTGLAFKDCEGVVLQYRGDGNRAAQPDEEHCHLVGLAGVKNFECPLFVAREIRGDGIYISQSDWAHESAPSEDLRFGTVRVTNSADDGRNAISIISVRKITIDRFVSVNVGGHVGGKRQPGGFDIEPNHPFQTCEDITVNTAMVRSAGILCFGALGRDSGKPEDWIVKRIKVGTLNSTNTSGERGGNGSIAAWFSRVDGLDVRGVATQTTTAAGTGLIVDDVKNADVRMRIARARTGAAIGPQGWVRNSTFDITVDSYGANGLEATGIADTTIAGKIAGGEGASPVAVLITSKGRAVRQQNVRYSVAVPRTNPAQRGYVNDPARAVQFDGCSIAYSGAWGYRGAAEAISGFGPGMNILGGNGSR